MSLGDQNSPFPIDIARGPYHNQLYHAACDYLLTYITSQLGAIFRMLSAVCETGGYLMSYWNRPFFPEWCSDPIVDDSATYDTMVRIAGSFAGIARAFRAVAEHYGWTHVVVVSDDETQKLCWYGAKPFGDVFGNDRNYTFTWLRLGAEPTDRQVDDILRQIRSLTRGFCRFAVRSPTEYWRVRIRLETPSITITWTNLGGVSWGRTAAPGTYNARGAGPAA